MERKDKCILLTFDVEEFDTPLRHKIRVEKDRQLEVGYEGLKNVYTMLDGYSHVPCTFYTTANFALHYPDIMKQISRKHEIASHTYYHSTFKPEHIAQSKEALENLIQTKIYGFRMPNMKSFDSTLIRKAGYTYDSSINPTFLPGKYNNLSKPITPYQTEHFVEVPASVVPFLRVPLFWLAFKNFPFHLYVQLCKITLRQTGLLHLYMHPWEFADLSSYNIPSYIITPHGEQLVQRLQKLIDILSKEKDVRFSTTIDFLRAKKLV